MRIRTGRAHNEAPRRAGRFLIALAAIAAVLSACVPAGGPNDPSTLQYVKRTVYGQQAQADAYNVGLGTEHPIVEFSVVDSPPSIFVNWPIPDAQAAAFAAFIGLKPGFTLAKVKILEDDPTPRYWLSLNVYRVSGITNGLRAEWSTYVDDGTGVPRFMIVRARAAEGSIDPIGPLAPPEPFQHALGVDDVITTDMKKTVIVDGNPVLTPDNLFNSTIDLPAVGDRDYVLPDKEWVAANDFIYWMNGVNDRTFYNSSAHSASLISVDLADVTVDDDSDWAPYLEPVPAHVLVYLDAIQFAIAPWWNVTETDGRVDAGTLASLREFKKGLYSGYSNAHALAVSTGGAQPTVRSDVEDTPPSTYWHWRIPGAGLAAFEAALGLPAGFSLGQVRLQEDDVAADHWLTLNVYRTSGALSGRRAEWSTYVDDGTGIHPMRIEARADHPSLDPTAIVDAAYPYTPAYPVSHALAGGTLSTTVGSGPTAFSSSFTVPAPATTVLASREWVGAGDLRYWRNGIVDKVYYDGSAFSPKISVDPGSVSLVDGGPWSAFVGAAPDRVWVDQGPGGMVINPWIDV